jgi:hypothetical protein
MRRLRRGLIAAVLPLALLTPMNPAQAHSVTFLSSVTMNFFVAANSSTTRTYYNNTGPSDRTWFVRVNLGLNGGNTTQFVRAEWYLIDQGISAEVARHHLAKSDDWVATGGERESATLVGHSGGTIHVSLDLFNNDSNGQDFFTWARAAHVTGL